MARILNPPRIIKTLPLQDATAPAAPRYAAGKPAVPADLEQTPRASDRMSTGETGGNFKMPTVSTGAGQTQAGIDSTDPNK